MNSNGIWAWRLWVFFLYQENGKIVFKKFHYDHYTPYVPISYCNLKLPGGYMLITQGNYILYYYNQWSFWVYQSQTRLLMYNIAILHMLIIRNGNLSQLNQNQVEKISLLTCGVLSHSWQWLGKTLESEVPNSWHSGIGVFPSTPGGQSPNNLFY